jgi:enoyl-CoA hydratase
LHYDAAVSPVDGEQLQSWLADPLGLESTHADRWEAHVQPAAFVKLAACSPDTRLTCLPPFPVIGLGDAHTALAASLDAVVEPPITTACLMRQISMAPHAAAVAVELLRNLRHLAPARALAFESLAYATLQGSGEHDAWLARRQRPATPVRPGRLLIEREGAALNLVLDRAEARNAIDRGLRDQLFDAFVVARLDRDIQRVTLRATGAAFSIGGDLQEFGTTRDPAGAHLIRARTLPATVIADCQATFEVHVQGACIGAGLEIAAFASRLTAEPGAWFQLPELAMGLIPGAGGCVSIPTRIGRQRAALMILSGRRVNAATALRWGLIDAIESRPPI